MGNPQTVTFRGEECRLIWGKYQNGRTAISLVVDETGERMATATVNLPAERLADGEVFIKDYAENEGMLDVLIKAEVIKPPTRYTKCGWVSVGACELVHGDPA